jgi:hypothetical protein
MQFVFQDTYFIGLFIFDFLLICYVYLLICLLLGRKRKEREKEKLPPVDSYKPFAKLTSDAFIPMYKFLIKTSPSLFKKKKIK